jgi:hypothetical protein
MSRIMGITTAAATAAVCLTKAWAVLVVVQVTLAILVEYLGTTV